MLFVTQINAKLELQIREKMQLIERLEKLEQILYKLVFRYQGNNSFTQCWEIIFDELEKQKSELKILKHTRS